MSGALEANPSRRSALRATPWVRDTAVGAVRRSASSTHSVGDGRSSSRPVRAVPASPRSRSGRGGPRFPRQRWRPPPPPRPAQAPTAARPGRPYRAGASIAEDVPVGRACGGSDQVPANLSLVAQGAGPILRLVAGRAVSWATGRPRLVIRIGSPETPTSSSSRRQICSNSPAGIVRISTKRVSGHCPSSPLSSGERSSASNSERAAASPLRR